MPLDPLLAGPRLVEVSHVAHRLGFSQDHERDLLRDGDIPAFRLRGRWRVWSHDVDAYIEKQRFVPTNGHGVHHG